MKICGIYKITSPSGKIYIGQSRDIKKRWRYHATEKKQTKIKLQRSFAKYGVDKHIFEIVEECTIEQLNEREIYYGTLFNVLEEGLNLKLGGSKILYSEEARITAGKAAKKTWDRKMSEGYVQSEEQRKKNSIGGKASWAKRKEQGYTVSQEVREKIRNTLTGSKVSEESNAKRSASLKLAYASGKRVSAQLGTKISDAHKAAISAANKGKIYKPESVKKRWETRKAKQNVI